MQWSCQLHGNWEQLNLTTFLYLAKYFAGWLEGLVWSTSVPCACALLGISLLPLICSSYCHWSASPQAVGLLFLAQPPASSFYPSSPLGLEQLLVTSMSSWWLWFDFWWYPCCSWGCSWWSNGWANEVIMYCFASCFLRLCYFFYTPSLSLLRWGQHTCVHVCVSCLLACCTKIWWMARLVLELS